MYLNIAGCEEFLLGIHLSDTDPWEGDRTPWDYQIPAFCQRFGTMARGNQMPPSLECTLWRFLGLLPDVREIACETKCTYFFSPPVPKIGSLCGVQALTIDHTMSPHHSHSHIASHIAHILHRIIQFSPHTSLVCDITPHHIIHHTPPHHSNSNVTSPASHITSLTSHITFGDIIQHIPVLDHIHHSHSHNTSPTSHFTSLTSHVAHHSHLTSRVTTSYITSHHIIHPHTLRHSHLHHPHFSSHFTRIRYHVLPSFLPHHTSHVTTSFTFTHYIHHIPHHITTSDITSHITYRTQLDSLERSGPRQREWNNGLVVCAGTSENYHRTSQIYLNIAGVENFSTWNPTVRYQPVDTDQWDHTRPITKSNLFVDKKGSGSRLVRSIAHRSAAAILDHSRHGPSLLFLV